MSCTFNEDDYRDQQLYKYLDEQDDFIVSNCCGALIYDESDICSKCKEHCVEVSKHEFDADAYEDAMCDRADAQRELERERDEERES